MEEPHWQIYRIYNHSTRALIITTSVDGKTSGHYRLLPGCVSPEDARPTQIQLAPTESSVLWDVWTLEEGFDVHVTDSTDDSDGSPLCVFGLGVQPRAQVFQTIHNIEAWASNPHEIWVTVLGAGITGLTAAHELVIRGFRVQVIEKAHGSPVDETHHRGIARVERGLGSPDVGGIARTQWTTQPLPRGETSRMSQPLPRSELSPRRRATPGPDRSSDDRLPQSHDDLVAMRSVHGDCYWWGRSATGETSCDGYWAFGVAWRGNGPRPGTSGEVLAWLRRLTSDHERSIAAVQVVVVVYRDPLDANKLQANAAYDRLKKFQRYLEHPEAVELRQRLDQLEVFPTARIEVDESAGHGEYVGLLVRVHEDLGLVAGEHGFRFFPGFYRHLRDTMRRTPIYDLQTKTFTSRTAHDNLTEVEWQVFADPQREYPSALRRKPFTSIGGLMEQYRNMRRDLGYRPVDLFRFLLRMLRYMTSSTKRRQHYYERLSWWDFLSLKTFSELTSEAPPFIFGRRFEEALRHAPKALVAMGARYTDARTQGNISVQLFMDQFALHEQSDSTLTGPTSSAWFTHWRTYLEHQGVRFILGEVTQIRRSEAKHDFRLDPASAASEQAQQAGEADADHCQRCGLQRKRAERSRCVPRAQVDIEFANGRPESFVDAEQLFLNGKIHGHYYVSAMDVVGLARTTRSFRVPEPPAPGQSGSKLKDSGVLSDLSKLLLHAGTERDLEDIHGVGRLGEHHGLSDRFQTLTGIQFYYRSYVSFENGHIYFASSPWGLSAVSQIQYWGPFGNGNRSRVAGNLSVDIGSWRAPRDQRLLDPNQFTRREIASHVQDQILRSLAKKDRGRDNAAAYYHLDDYIGFSVRDDRALPARNHAPFLINVVDDWKNRPRGNPWAPNDLRARNRLPGEGKTTADGIWCHRDDGYLVHFGNLVVAGTHMRTFTRMGTMEAANESARHAVNTILDHLSFRRRSGVKPPGPALRDAEPEAPEPVPRPDYVPNPPPRSEIPQAIEVDRSTTPYGDYCQIWDPEQHEFSDLEFLRLVDDYLMEATLRPRDDLPDVGDPEPIAPHLFDILRIDELPDLIEGDPQALGAFELLGSSLAAFQEASCDSLPSVFAIVEKVRKQLSALFERKK